MTDGVCQELKTGFHKSLSGLKCLRWDRKTSYQVCMHLGRWLPIPAPGFFFVCFFTGIVLVFTYVFECLVSTTPDMDVWGVWLRPSTEMEPHKQSQRTCLWMYRNCLSHTKWFQIFRYLNKWACRGSLILIMFVLSICTSFDRQEWGVAIEGLGESV